MRGDGLPPESKMIKIIPPSKMVIPPFHPHCVPRVGFAKAAGNYGAQFYPTNLAKEEGFQQIIWTDANSHEYLEEAGTMNIFFRIGNKLVTAPTNDRILDGVTRKSVLKLAEENNIEKLERQSIHENGKENLSNQENF